MLVLLWTKIVDISNCPKRSFLVCSKKLGRSLNGLLHPPAAVGTQRRVAADCSRAASPAATDCIPGNCGGDDDDHLKKNTLIRDPVLKLRSRRYEHNNLSGFSCDNRPWDEFSNLLRRGRRPTGQTRPPRSGRVSWRAAATTASPAGSASA